MSELHLCDDTMARSGMVSLFSAKHCCFFRCEGPCANASGSPEVTDCRFLYTPLGLPGVELSTFNGWSRGLGGPAWLLRNVFEFGEGGTIGQARLHELSDAYTTRSLSLSI